MFRWCGSFRCMTARCRLCLACWQADPCLTLPCAHVLPQASTLGSLEALLTFLSSKDVNIPVSGINIGPVHKRDIMRANVMNEKSESSIGVALCVSINSSILWRAFE